METYTYYRNGTDLKRKVTVVLLRDGNNIARGIAVCNDLDHFNRKRGRSIAMGRAEKAFYNQQSCIDNEIHREEICDITPKSFKSKCEFNPILTDYEKKLLKI